jgi:hypothetical protein
MAEWSLKPSPVVRFLGDNGRQDGAHRRLLGHDVRTFPGGFVSCGSIIEGVDTRLEETGRCTDQAGSYIAFATLPDGIACVGLQYVWCAPERRCVLTELKGCIWESRTICLTTAAGPFTLPTTGGASRRRLLGTKL